MIPGLSSLYVKLIGGVLAVLILGALVADRGRWMHRAHNDEAELATICAAVRAAADNPKMDCKAAAQQIGLMGQAVATLKEGIGQQNAIVAAQGQATVQQQRNAAQASQEAHQRAKGPEKAAADLNASSRSSERLSAPCQPSKALQEAWK